MPSSRTAQRPQRPARLPHQRRWPRLRRLQPLALASLLALSASGLNAAQRTFAGPGSFWDVVANWTGGIVPGAADDALLGAFNTEVRTSFTINSFSGTGALTVSAGTLTFASASSIGTLNLTGGSLAGAGSLVVAGASTWTAGAMSGTGTTTFGGTLAISGNGLKDITNGRTVNFNGTTTWSNATAGQGRIRTGSSATLNNNGTWLDQSAFANGISNDFGGTASTFNNAGTYAKSGAGTTNIAIAFNNTRTVAGTGVVDVSAGSLLLTGGGTSNGSFTGAAGTTLGFGGNHTLQAASSISTAGAVDFSSGTNTVAGNFNAGTGTSFSGGTTTFSGTVTGIGSTITANGGTGVFNNTQAFSVSGLVLTSGGLTFNNTGGVTTTSLSLAGGTLAGTAPVTVSGATTWTSGTMSGTGTTTLGGAVALSTSSTKDITNGRIVNFNGTTTWVTPAVAGTPGTPEANGGRIRTGSNATLNNNGTWLDLNPQDNFISPDFGGPASTFVNAGVYTKSGAGTTAISIGFNNTSGAAGTGVVNLNAGSLQFTGGGTSNGSFVGAAGTTFGFGGNHTLQAASSINAAGAVGFSSGTNSIAGSFNAGTATHFSGGTTTFTGTVSGVGSTITASGGTGVFNNTQAFNVAGLVLSSGNLSFNNTGGVTTSSLNLSGGTLAGSSTVTVSGSTNWTSGAMTGSGTTTLNTDLALNTVGLKDITNGRTVNFNGTTTWTTPAASQGRIRTGSGATLNNNGTWLDQNALNNSISQDFGGPASTFVNAGVYTKSGAGTTNINIAFNNTRSTAGTGVVNIDAGRLLLEGGGTSNGSFAGAGSLEFNGGTFALLAASSVTAANVVFNSGTANIAGSYNVATSTRFSGGTASFTGSVANSGGTLSFTTGGGTANFSNTAGVQFGSLSMAAGTIGGTQAVSFAGASTWAAGGMTGAGSIHFNGDVALTTAGLKDITNDRTVNFNGITTWLTPAVPGTPGTPEANGGRIRTGSNATLINNGTWLDRNPQDNAISQDFGGPASTFVNAGVYTKSGAGTTQIAIAFSNAASAPGTGVVNINAGRLQLSGGGTSNGSFTGPGTLEFNGGTQALQAGSSIGNPNVVFSGGTTNVAGSYNVATSTQFSGGTANFTGSVANSGGALSFTTGGGTANFSNAAGVQFSSLSMAAGAIGGTQLVRFTGPSTWLAGNMTGAGTTTFASTLALNTAGLKDVTNGRIVNFDGTTTWAAGRLRTGSSATLRNNGTWLDQNAVDAQISQDFGGPASTFVNAGTYAKTSAGTTFFSIAFDNTASGPGTGVFNLDAGRLLLNGGGSSSGSFAVAAGTTLEFSGVAYTLGGAVTGVATSRLLVSGGTLDNTTAKNFGGLLELTSGTLSAGQALTAATFLQTGGTVAGAGALQVSGPATWTSGTMTGAGTTIFAGNLALNTNGLKDVNNGRTVNFNGTTTWNNATAGQGRIRTGSSATLNNNGTWLDQSGFNNAISQDFGGPASTFVNAGTYTKSGAATTAISIGFNNSGTVNVNAGTLTLTGGLSNFSGTTLTGGRFNVTGPGTFSFSGANVVTNAAGITLDGAGSQFLNATNSANGLANFATNAAAGSFTLRNGRNFTSAGAFTNAGDLTVGTGSTFTGGGASFSNVATGELLLQGGTQAGAALANAGLVEGFGTMAAALTNSGTLRASGGTLAANLGVQGATGTVAVAAGATLNLDGSAAPSSAATLALLGSLASLAGLDLGAQSFSVLGDYTNASFGSGNSFDARAGVSGTGLIVGVNAAQALTGDVQASGANAYLLDFGTVRGGTTATRSFQIANTGTGASIRGALQTGTPGLGSLNDARLSGNGTVAASFGAIAAGNSSGSFSITLDASGNGGALNGQTLAVLSNFGNVATQTVTLGGFSTVLAQGAATPAGPLDLGNFRVGLSPAVSTTLAVSNTTTGAGAERLGLASATASGNFSATSTLGNGLVLPGATATGAVTVASSGGTVGVNSGSVALQFTSNGQLFDASFTQLATNLQTVDVQATGYLLAQPSLPASVALGNFRLVDGASSAFTLTNSNGAPAGFQEVLNASVGATTAGVTLSGAVNGLAPGVSSNAFVIGFAAGGNAGPRSGSGTVNLFSDGSGTSGLGLLSLPGGAVAVTGTAFNLAVGAATPTPVVVPNQRVGGVGGGSASVALNIANTAPAGSFSEALNASFASLGGDATSNGGSVLNLAAGASNGSAMVVSLNNAQAGARSGSVTLAYASDGTGPNGNSGLAAVAAGGQTINLSGNVYRLAQASAVTPGVVNLGTVRAGTALSQALTLANLAVADGFSESLNATIAGTPGLLVGGSFSGLAAGASSSALFVGVDTSSAGAKNGTATLTLASDGAGTSGFGALPIGTQLVTVSGDVFRLAVPLVDTTPLALAGRVGDATLQAAIPVRNNAPDLFTERLNASIASAPAAVLAGPALVGLQPNASGSLGLSLPTSVAGSFSGAVGVALVSSSAGTTSGAPDAPLGTVNVAFDGRIYAPAMAQLPATVVDFGTVRVGDVLAPRTVTVANTASGALTDTLQASLSGGGAPFSASGSVAGIVAGSSNSSALQVQLATTTAGVFSGASTVQLRSQNPDLPDLALASLNVQLLGQVNNLAQSLLAQAGGSGTFSGAGLSYTLDFGTLFTDPSDPNAPSGTLLGTLLLGNAATGPADALAGSWNLAALSSGPFSVAGFSAFTGLAAGSQLASLTVNFNLANEGSFSRTLVLNSFSTNGSGPDLALGAVTLTLQGTVVAVPEPGTYLMMAVGVLAMGSIARRKLRAQRG